MTLYTTPKLDDPTADRMRRLRRAIYASDRRATGPGDLDPTDALDRPEFDGRRHIIQLVDAGEPVAQAVARLSPELTGDDGAPVGTIGHFEARQNSHAATRVLQEAVDWLTERGAGRIVGPMNGDIWHGYRFSVGPHARDPCLMEPYNPPWYAPMWADAGFEVCQTCHTRYGERLDRAVKELKPGWEQARAAGYRFLSLAEADVDDPVGRVYRMLTLAFQVKEFVTDITEAEFRRLFGGVAEIIDPELTWFARDADGQPAGFVFGLPNYHRAVAAMNRAPEPLAKPAFVWNARPDTAALHSIGVGPSHRRQGLGYGLTYKLYSTVAERGYRGLYGLLLQEGTPAATLATEFADPVRRYVLYEYRREP